MKFRPTQMAVVADKRVRFEATDLVRAASGKKLAYPARPGRMTGREGERALAEVNFGPDHDGKKDVVDWVPREALVPA